MSTGTMRVRAGPYLASIQQSRLTQSGSLHADVRAAQALQSGYRPRRLGSTAQSPGRGIMDALVESACAPSLRRSGASYAANSSVECRRGS